MQNNRSIKRRVVEAKMPPYRDDEARAARPGVRRRLAWALMPADMREAWMVGFLTETNPGGVLDALLDAALAAMADEEDRG